MCPYFGRGKYTQVHRFFTHNYGVEQIRQSPLLLSDAPSDGSKRCTGTFVLAGSGDGLQVLPVSRVVSALPRSDLILLSCSIPPGRLNTLPVSPYPAHVGAKIRAHFVRHEKPDDTGWSPWIGDTWGKWHEGKVLGYRDFAGRETEVSCTMAKLTNL